MLVSSESSESFIAACRATTTQKSGPTNIVGWRPALLRTTPAHASRDSRAGLLVAAEQAGEWKTRALALQKPQIGFGWHGTSTTGDRNEHARPVATPQALPEFRAQIALVRWGQQLHGRVSERVASGMGTVGFLIVSSTVILLGARQPRGPFPERLVDRAAER